MEEAKHTPGPWYAEQQLAKSGESLGWIINHGNGRIGWSSYATARPNEGEAAPYPIGGANALLMAASPDLLDFAEVCLTARHWFEGNPDGALGEIEHRARALIAKATALPA